MINKHNILFDVFLPFYKYPSLHCMDDAPESRLLLGTTLGHAHLPAEGARQPITYLAGHRLRLQVAELVFSVQQTPAEQKETPVSLDNRRPGLILHACPSVGLFSRAWSRPCKQSPAWRQRAPGSCGVPAGPRRLGPSAPGPPSA